MRNRFKYIKNVTPEYIGRSLAIFGAVHLATIVCGKFKLLTLEVRHRDSTRSCVSTNGSADSAYRKCISMSFPYGGAVFYIFLKQYVGKTGVSKVNKAWKSLCRYSGLSAV